MLLLFWFLSLAKHLHPFDFVDLKSHWNTWKNAFRYLFPMCACVSSTNDYAHHTNTRLHTKFQLHLLFYMSVRVCGYLRALHQEYSHTSIENDVEESDWVKKKNHTHTHTHSHQNSHFLISALYSSKFIMKHEMRIFKCVLRFLFVICAAHTNLKRILSSSSSWK